MIKVGSIPEFILGKIKHWYPDYPSRIEFAEPEEEGEENFVIGVYMVPRDKVKGVENYIHKLNREVIGDANYYILSHVCNEDITEKFYPEMKPYKDENDNPE